jgi:hypothetical protein
VEKSQSENAQAAHFFCYSFFQSGSAQPAVPGCQGQGLSGAQAGDRGVFAGQAAMSATVYGSSGPATTGINLKDESDLETLEQAAGHAPMIC